VSNWNRNAIRLVAACTTVVLAGCSSERTPSTKGSPGEATSYAQEAWSTPADAAAESSAPDAAADGAAHDAAAESSAHDAAAESSAHDAAAESSAHDAAAESSAHDAAADAVSHDGALTDAVSTEAGPACVNLSDPFGEVDGGAMCAGGVIAATFARAVCSCTTVSASAVFSTDGFDSTVGGPNGGPGGDVASDGNETWSSHVTVGGNLITPGNLTSTESSTVRGNLTVGGTLSASALFAVDGNASVAHLPLPSQVHVVGTTTLTSSVAPPCNCTQLLPVASIVAAHRPPHNDNASIGLSATEAMDPQGSGSGACTRSQTIDLPCGNYYLSGINATAAPLAIDVHGQTALYVDGNIQASASLSFNLDSSATLDLFVTGSVSTSAHLTLGSTGKPAHCRAYVAGSTFHMSGGAAVGCNVYAPSASWDMAASSDVYGALFVNSLQESAQGCSQAALHYDTSILKEGAGCCTASSCDDGNPCTADACNGNGGCSHTPVENGTTCSGTNQCEQTYSCQAGACVGSNPVACTASDACHAAGTCDPTTGVCSNPAAANGTACNDGNACTLSDSCQAGVCTGASPVVCTASDACHAAGTCDPTTGACSNPAAANGTACNDGNACTLSDSCQAGVCTGASPVVCTASDACHAVGACDPTTGACSNPAAANGTACNDGNACTLSDSCQAGVCAGASPVVCTASDACHAAGTCNPATGACSNPAVTDGTACVGTNACNQSYACAAGTCVGSNPVVCPGPQPQFASTAPMSVPRQQHTATRLSSGDVLVTGGASSAPAVNSTETYRVSSAAWTDSAPMISARQQHAAVALPSGKVLVAGGVDATGTPIVQAEIYDPTVDEWTAASPMNAAHTPARAVALPNGQVLVSGFGTDASGCVVSSEIYNPAADAWTVVTDAANPAPCDSTSIPGTGSGGLVVPLADGSVAAAGGYLQPGLTENMGLDRYVTGAPSWAPLATLPAPRLQSMGAGLSSGSLLIVGGFDAVAGTQDADALIFDPMQRSFAPAGSMSAARFNTAIAALPNGALLVPGGSSQAGVASADLYAPTSGTWTPVSGGATRVSGLTATALANGSILVAGGAGPTSQPLATADLFSAPDAQCMASSCNPASGNCSLSPKPDGTPCSDSNLCMQTHACQGGYCVGSNPVTCGGATGQCQAAECNPSTGACVTTSIVDGTACNDGNACTLVDTCAAGTCVGSNPVVCTASDSCHAVGSCNPASGACSNPAAADGTTCNDGNACTQTDTCLSGTCTGSNPVVCTASDPCHAVGSCDPTSGACSNPAAADGTTCNDGNACTLVDACALGVCVGSNPVVCTASDPCHTAGSCNPASGACSNPAAADGTTCNDGNACTLVDACALGVCVGGNPVVCTASDPCHAVGSCDPTSGACSNPAAADGTTCNDGNACTQTDACLSGTCTGSNPVVCAASDPCHGAGSCNPASGACSNPSLADGTTCNDGNACTQTDACLSGTCTGSNPVVCAAGDQCHAAGSCNPASGACSNPPLADGTACSGSNLCNQSYVCTGGSCTGENPVVCQAADACHVAGACDPTSGVCSNPLNPGCPPGLPPDPALVAPPIDRTVVTSVYTQTQFLYSGQYPIQTGVAAGTILPTRVCEVHGSVLVDDGSSEPGVVVTVVAHPELGQTMSRLDGRFDIVINGGGPFTIAYAKQGYLPTQRIVDCPWQAFVTAPTVIMVPPDPNITTVNFGSSASQTFQGSVVTDQDGTRQATCVVAGGTTANLVMPNGSTTPFATGSFRITEYTVGPNGDERMPSDLPPTSAYTYAVDIDADEASAAGATSIQLSQPATCYTTNFLNFPVGTAVPLGSFQLACGAACASGELCGTWIPQNNGDVIEILSVAGGIAAVDTNGSGVPATAATLTALGITTTELQTLAQLYPPGVSVWRTSLPHFSIWDANWGYGPPPDAVCPNPGPSTVNVKVSCHDGPTDAFSQTSYQSQPIAGTPYNLVYQSDRVQGGRTVPIPLSGPTVPASLKRIDMQLTVAGTTTTQSFPPQANLTYEYPWTGVDAFGRQLQGMQTIWAHVTFVYNGFYSTATTGFGGYGLPIQGDETRREIYCPRDFSIEPSWLDETPTGLGGFNLDVHHTYDPSGAVYLGDGTTQTGESIGPIITQFAGNGPTPATSATTAASAAFQTPGQMAVAADGSLYVIDANNTSVGTAIYRIAPNGAMTRVAGTGTAGYNGDGIPATQAQINPYYGQIAMARECDGGFYFADLRNQRIRYVDGQGIIHTIAGNGTSGDEYVPPLTAVPAIQSTLTDPAGVAVGPDGAVYAGLPDGAILKIDKNGIQTWIAGVWWGIGGYSGTNAGNLADGIPALQAGIAPQRLVVSADGSVFEMESFNGRIRRVGVDGIITSVAGGGSLPFVDGINALSTYLFDMTSMAIRADGTIYFSTVCEGATNGCNGVHGVLALTPDGRLTQVAGGPGAITSGNGFLATQTGLSFEYAVGGIALGPDGSIYTSENNFRGNQGPIIRRIQPPLAGVGAAQFLVGAANSREEYVFDAEGRHLETIDTLTGAPRLTFGYDASGRLASVTDVAGNVTTIQHDGSGNPLAIVAPFGQTTTLAVGAGGLLSSLSNPASQSSSMTYSASQPGLLTSVTDPSGNTTQFTYDSAARLSQTANGIGGVLNYSSSIIPAQTTVTQTTGLGVTSVFTDSKTSAIQETRTEALPSGQTVTQVAENGVITETQADGTVANLLELNDPFFGSSSPFLRQLGVKTPSGLSFQQTTSLNESLTTTSPPTVASRSYTTGFASIAPFGFPSTNTSYTASNRTTVVTTLAGRTRTETLDTLGRLAGTQQGALLPQAFTYDTHGHLASLAQGTRTRLYAYDANGMLAQTTDPLGQATSLQRDPVGRVTSETLPDGQGAGFSYDPNGRLASMTTPTEEIHQFTHSPVGQLTSYTAPPVVGAASTTTAYGYDGDGDLTSLAEPDGSSATLAYDAAGRLSSVTLPNGSLGFAYDPTTGHVGSVTGFGGETIAYTYDGMLTRNATWAGPVRGTIAWQYDTWLKVINEAVDGQGVSFAYDDDGMLTKAGLMTLAFNGNAQLTSTALGKFTDAITYDGFGQRATYTAKLGTTTIFSETYTRDTLGRIATKVEAVQGTSHTYGYAYDARGRLTSVTKDGASFANATYDANGNRVAVTTPNATLTGTFDAQDRLLGQGTVSYAYGPNGEVQSRTDSATGRTTTFEYDPLGNLVHVGLSAGDFVDYIIDGAGRRVAKAFDGTLVKQWIYRDALRPAAELDGNGNILKRFVYGDKRDGVSPVDALRARLGLTRPPAVPAASLATPTYIVSGGQTLRVVTDHLGSPRLLVNTATGNVLQALDYDPWGALISETGADLPTSNFAGGLYDGDTGLIRFGARDYDPQTGRWTSKEPIKTSGTLNFYQYAGGDPVNGADVDGLAQSPSTGQEQTLLDSICGAGAQGEVQCTLNGQPTSIEAVLASTGSSAGAATDTTGGATPQTDLPATPTASDATSATTSGPTATGAGVAPVNAPPTVTISPATLTTSVPATNVAISGTATDDGLWQPLQVLWSMVSGPAEAVFANAGSASTTASFPVGGVYVVQLAANDGEYISTANLTVTVNAPPVVSIVGPTTLAVTDTPTYLGDVIELVPGKTVATAWTAVSGPGVVTFASPAAVSTTASFSTAGNYVLQLEANDGTYTSFATLPVSVIAVNQPPVVSAGAAQVLTAPMMTTTLAGNVTDDGLPVGATLTSTWTLVSGPAPVTFSLSTQSAPEPGPLAPTTTVNFVYPGTYVFQLLATDTVDTSTATTTVTINPPVASSPTAPVLSMSGVSDDEVVTMPVQVLGNVSEGSWRLEERLGGRDDVQTAYTVIASGTGTVSGGPLGTFDPTLMLNGVHTLRLLATTTAGESVTSFSLSVDGRMKVGDFTLTFTDLQTAVSGIPFTLDRIYDSRDKAVGDFGVGWNLGIRDVRVDKSGEIGAYWVQNFYDDEFFSQFCLDPLQAATVTVTFPNGREYRFAAQSSPECQYLEPLTTPDIVWQCTSDPNNPTIQLQAAGGTSVFTNGTTQPVELLTDQGDIWDPRQFTLTVEDGTVYQIDQDKGVTSLADRNGNTLTITPGGILSSSGKNVTFTRDAQSRITQITDPAGKTISYVYDGAGDLASDTDRLGYTTQYAYAGNHYLQDIEDPLGRRPIRSDYDDSGRLISQTDALGNTVNYSHDVPGQEDVVTDRLGHATVYVYNDRGDIIQKTDATGAVWNYTFDIYGNKLSETDPVGNLTVSTYNGQNALASQTDPLGNVTSYTYNQFKQLLTTTDPLGRVTASTYDSLGDLMTTTDATGAVTSYVYCATNSFDPSLCPAGTSGNPLTKTDPLGNVTTYAYDAYGHPIKTTDPLGHVTSDTFDINGMKLSETVTQTPLGTLTTNYQYDAAERLLSTTYVDGSSTSTTYSPTSKRLTSTDELGRVTSYSYDDEDHLVATAHPDGTTDTQTYDAENRRLSSTDPAGNTTAYAYDNVARLTQTTYADGGSAATSYDSAGRAVSSTDELGRVTVTAYDAAGRSISVTDPAGAVNATKYDAAGNALAATDPLGHTTLTTYDSDNRPVVTTYADGTADRTTYDATGRLVAKTDPLGRVTSFGYDALGRLTTVTDAAGNITTYAYDELGHRVSQTDANAHVTSFAYDSRGREITRTLPDKSSETKAYDVAGELTKRTDFNAQVTSYTYDSLGRLLSRTYPDASVVSFTYTPDGRRATAVDARGTTSYAYDARRRLVQETYPDGRTLAFTYDAHGERTGVTANVGGQSLTTTTGYDPDGRPNQVTDPLGRAFSLTYDAAGNRSSIAYPNATNTSYGYDPLNRLTSLTTTGTTASDVVQSYAYSLDAAGKRTAVAESGGVGRAYGYDAIDRLTTETVTGSLAYSKAFTYDSVGNRLTQTTTGAGASGLTYTYDTRDRLSTAATAGGSTVTYSYDGNGNLIAKSDEASYAWDFENRLTAVDPNVGPVNHTYDADGNRVRTVAPSGEAQAAAACNGNGATFVTSDTTTQGNWQGAYGSDGFYMAYANASPPSYGSVTFANNYGRLWATSTTDVRDLENPAPATGRTAASWYTGNYCCESFDVSITDGNAHTVAFYLLDWNNGGRVQSIVATDPSGNVLDSRTYSNFTNGVWAVYTVCGNVTFTVNQISNFALVSGVFFGPSRPPVTTNYLVDTSGGLSQVVADTDGSGNLDAYYVRVGGELVEEVRPGGTAGTWSTRFVHSDGLGSVRALTDETGALVDARGYEAFGTKNVEAGSDPLAYGFAGEPFEAASHLAYHRARWMDARVGRFEGMDPERGHVKVPLSLNKYIYAGSEPVGQTDPTGREYDMASVGAALDVNIVLSTLATVSLAEVATDIVCQIALATPGVPINPSRCPNLEYYNHYADQQEYNTVGFFGEIWPPNGFVYLTKTRYLTAASAQAYLALPREPVGFWAIPSTNLTFVEYLGPAEPQFGQPGGGNEWFTYPPVFVANAVWTWLNE